MTDNRSLIASSYCQVIYRSHDAQRTDPQRSRKQQNQRRTATQTVEVFKGVEGAMGDPHLQFPDLLQGQKLHRSHRNHRTVLHHLPQKLHQLQRRKRTSSLQNQIRRQHHLSLRQRCRRKVVLDRLPGKTARLPNQRRNRIQQPHLHPDHGLQIPGLVSITSRDYNNVNDDVHVDEFGGVQTQHFAFQRSVNPWSDEVAPKETERIEKGKRSAEKIEENAEKANGVVLRNASQKPAVHKCGDLRSPEQTKKLAEHIIRSRQSCGNQRDHRGR